MANIPVIQAEDALRLKKQNRQVVIVAACAQSLFSQAHLGDAVCASPDDSLAAISSDPARGGRHPLPDIEQFGAFLGRLGISGNSHVLVYDHMGGANAAARFWWMLRAAGHKKVQVINGGMDAALKAGFAISNKAVPAKQAPVYKFSQWQLPTAAMEEVEQAATANDRLVIDVRDKNRFDGITEPIDPVAGHIPGAVNIPFAGNLDDKGLFLSPAALKEKYSGAIGTIKPATVIVHCGSGVTACHTLLAFDYAGLPIPKLYVGSWSEWSRNGKSVASSPLRG